VRKTTNNKDIRISLKIEYYGNQYRQNRNKPKSITCFVFSVFFSLGAIALISSSSSFSFTSVLFIQVHQLAVLFLLVYYVYLDAESRDSTNPILWGALMGLLVLLAPHVGSILVRRVNQFMGQVDGFLSLILFTIPTVLYVIPPALYVVFRGEKKSDRHDHELPALTLLIALASSFVLTNVILRYEVVGMIWTTTNYVIMMLVLLLLTYAVSHRLVDTYVGKRASAG